MNASEQTVFTVPFKTSMYKQSKLIMSTSKYKQIQNFRFTLCFHCQWTDCTPRT